MKHRKSFIITLFIFCLSALSQATPTNNHETRPDPIHVMDSLLSHYHKASNQKRTGLARQIMALNDDDLLIDIDRGIDGQQPTDSMDFLVWLSAERFYYNKSYFKESLEYIDRALTLAEGNAPEYHATLLCDRGYCLFKTSRNTEAIQAEMEAETFSRQHHLLLPLARAYNYLAIINLALGNIDEAKHFVGRALDTDRQTGSNRNTHNYLGIACEVYSVAKEPDKAVDYGRQAVEAARAIGYDEGVVNHLSQLSYAYNRKGDLRQALAMSEEAVATVERMQVVDRNLLAISLEYVAFNLLDMKRNSEAAPVIRRAIALQQELGNMRSVCYDHKSLAEALEPDEPREAFAALRRYSQMMDSLHYAEMHETLSQANAALHNEELQEANEDSQRRMRLIIIASVVGLLLLLGIIAVLGYLNRMKTRTQQAVRQLQTARESFFTNVTHELRTPLTIILGTTQQLLKSADAETSESLSAIDRNGQSLLALVNQLLDISKVTTSTGQVRWQEGDVATFIGMVVDRFRPAADMKDIRLEYQKPQEPLHTFFVADYIQKIVSNLLSNALKFSPENGRVGVKVNVLGNSYVLSVTDHGAGILAEDIDHVFEPFYQGANNTHEGTGVGLALVNHLTKALAGNITVTSEPGVETTFTATLPLKHVLLDGESLFAADGLSDEYVTPPEIAAEPKRPHEKGVDGNAADDGRTRILVVEDNADMATYIGSVIEGDYAVSYAANGAEGLQMAEQIMPDLIVTDVMMPDVDGLELCRRIRQSELTNHIPIIIVTARVEDRDRIQGIKAGADAYLYKPFMPEELMLRITKLLEAQRRLRRKFAAVAEKSEDSEGAEHSEDSEKTEKSENTELSKTYARFLGKLDNVILRLMAEGRSDAASVAQEMGMSRQQLGRKLRAVADATPSEYILRLRLDEVHRLLDLQPELTLLDVAMRCGFADHAHLTHVFQRRFGISPSQYKAKGSQNGKGH